uniref:Uncharacterized protein n=1 Tax=Neogoniolithon spectabile TaxID=231755 RepID=A0A3G3MGZ7_9FLOR|nr:hypothetical protein [Neogoniolithon spectabile]AYR06097.1 hypothetical protein [Neogoniolithon spectabile]
MTKKTNKKNTTPLLTYKVIGWSSACLEQAIRYYTLNCRRSAKKQQR